jgi:hypothetical protein
MQGETIMYIKYPGKNYYKRVYRGRHLVSIKLISKVNKYGYKHIHELPLYTFCEKIFIAKTPLSQLVSYRYIPTLESKSFNKLCGYKGKNYYLSSFNIRSKNRYTFSSYSYSQDTLLEAYFNDDFDDCGC